MRIIWFSITPPASGVKSLGFDSSFSGGGWVDSLLRFIPFETEDIELWSLFLIWGTREILRAESSSYKNLHYIGIPSVSPYLDRVSQEMGNDFNDLIDEINPDIIHIFGTETENSNYFLSHYPDKKKLVSITGLVSRYRYHYFGGIESELKHYITLRDCVRGTINSGYKKMCRNAEIELDSLNKTKYITGRTSWDRSITKIENPDVRYYFCNENLRDSFYCHQWEYSKCEKFTIFSSSSASPLKGVHQLIRAFNIVKKRYPQSRLYITGNNVFTQSFISKMRLTGYQKYLSELIVKLNLKESVFFTGILNEEQMADMFCRSHVYVLPSAIENSPNSLCEAMCIGVPTVASAVGGVPDLLEHENEGFLYPFDEFYTLADYIIQIFENKQKAMDYSKHARERALKRHDRSNNANTMMQIYRSIIEDKP